MTKEEAIAFGERVIDLGFKGETQEFCELAISALKGGWIPIEERKPKHKQEVFVTYETEDGIKADKTIYHDRYGFAISPNVIAWKPCEPYKKGE